MRVRIEIDQSRCIGCGLCEETIPEIFETGEFSARTKESIAELSEDLAAAAHDCPTEAISLTRLTEDVVDQS